MNNFGDVKDRAVLTSWVLVLLLLTCLIWVLTQPMQTNYLLRAVNNVFNNNNDTRRLSEYLPRKTKNPGLMGYWYSMNNTTDKMFVFAIFHDGILVPLGAVVSDDGFVKEVIPLSAHAVQIFNNLPENIIKIYIARIEGNR